MDQFDGKDKIEVLGNEFQDWLEQKLAGKMYKRQKIDYLPASQ